MTALSQVEKNEFIKRILDNTDWKAYWDSVAKKCDPEIEAYRKARAASAAKAHEHWVV